METNHKRGAPPGNQNARKHGFYATILSDTEKAEIAQAVEVEGIDEEIAVLRVKLKSILINDPDNIKLIMQAAESIARLLNAKNKPGKGDKNAWKTGLEYVIKNAAIPFSVDVAKRYFTPF